MSPFDLLAAIRNTRFLKQPTKIEYLKRISDFLKITKKDLNYVLLNPEYAINQIMKYTEENGHGMHTADKIARCFMAVFNFNQSFREENKEAFDSWNKIVKKKIKNVIDAKYNSNAPTDRQIGAYTSYENIIEKRNKLKKGSIERLLLFMYTAIPPVRNDYHNLKIYFKKPKFDVNNYLIFRQKNNSVIVLNEFKTDKTYDSITINIPPELYDEIHDSLTKEPRDFLFVSTQNGLPYNSPNTFSKWANRTLKAIFKNDISLTTLRHVYITRRDLKLETKSGIERKRIADIMGHSLNQQQKYLWHSWVDENKNKE
jgi:hypothetical protein